MLTFCRLKSAGGEVRVLQVQNPDADGLAVPASERGSARAYQQESGFSACAPRASRDVHS